MFFNSYIFILLFLPLSVTGYFLLNHFGRYRAGKLFLLLMSLWFYGYFNVMYLPIICTSVLFNYFAALLLGRENKNKKLILTASLLINILGLFYFKYYNFFIGNLNTAIHSNFNLIHVILPLGISFFTFQQISFLVDTYKGQSPVYPFLDYALYATFFPYVSSGPISYHGEIIPQFQNLEKKHLNFENISKGLAALSFGLVKKTILADTFGVAADWGFSNVISLNATEAFFVMLAYTLQIYFDFSGYCDIATGVAMMLNIDIPINFNSPYRSYTITEFWKKWHITLTRFFTKYLYIPLGGNRKGTLRTYCNMMIVFLVSGLWHGANWTFILWGAMHGAASVATKRFKSQIDHIHPVLNWLVTFLFVNIAWVFFRAPSISVAFGLVKTIFSMRFGPLSDSLTTGFMLPEINVAVKLLGISSGSMPVVITGMFFAFAVFAVLQMKNTQERTRNFKPSTAMAVLCIFFLVWSVVSFTGITSFVYVNF